MSRKMTRQESGRLGGLATKRRYGVEYYGVIGREGGSKGGSRTRDLYGSEFYRAIGRKGGRAPHRPKS